MSSISVEELIYERLYAHIEQLIKLTHPSQVKEISRNLGLGKIVPIDNVSREIDQSIQQEIRKRLR